MKKESTAPKSLNKLRLLQKELETCFAERNAQIEAMLVALIAGVHVLLLGPPGTAKSMLANILCKTITGANFFAWLMTKFTTPEEVFGPVSMSGLKNDQYRRITTSKLPEAHIAFLDEPFKSNSAILNSMLSLLNERKFYNDGQPVTTPLLTCVGASNELPQGEELGALFDRFLFRFWVNYIEDDDTFIDLVNPTGNVGKTVPTTTLTLQDVAELHDMINSVKVSDDLLQNVRKICHDLRRAGINASDRRWKSAVDVLRAYALLRGQDEVSPDELEALADMMWDRPEDRSTIQKTVAPFANPLNLKAIEFLDFAKDAFKQWQAVKDKDDDDSAARQCNTALKGILKSIDELLSTVQDSNPRRTAKLIECRSQVKQMRETVFRSLGLGDL